jgi:chromosome segregation ATPase
MVLGIPPSAAKPFVKAMAVVGKKHEERKRAHNSLEHHLEEMKKASAKKKNISKHVDELQEHIAHVIQAEKQFAGYDLGTDEKLRELEQEVAMLEQQLQEEHEQHAMQIAQYKHTIDDMKRTFASLKTKMVELINDKRERDRRLQALHEKIEQGVATPSPSRPSYQQPPLPPGFRY